jgi:hypothetical protein
MKRSWIRGWWLLLPALALAVTVWGCGSKKKDAAVPEAPAWKLNVCPVARIEVTPAKVEDPELILKSDREVKFEATAYDAEGKVVDTPLTWRFRYCDTCGASVEGGHHLTAVDDRHAIFKADGNAAGEFAIVVEDTSCNLSDKDHPQYAEGETWVRVRNPPDAEMACGRMRVTYGDHLDRMGEQVYASSGFLLIAEIEGQKKAARGYKVRFYFNDQAAPELAPLYRDVRGPTPGEAMAFKALLPVYLTPGDHAVRYELLKGKEVVCGSNTERFKAK